MLSTVPSTTPLSETAVLAALAPDGGRQEAVGDVTDTAVRIMLAAADAFADRGFHATTTRDIASRAASRERKRNGFVHGHRRSSTALAIASVPWLPPRSAPR